MEKLETSKIKSYISFCNTFFLFLPRNIHDKNKETMFYILLDCIAQRRI